MKPAFAFADEDVLLAPTPAFAVRHSCEMPTYYELELEDGQGNQFHWVISAPPKQLAKRPVLLWQLAAASRLSAPACVETGSVQIVSGRPGTGCSLRAGLKQGLLRLNFNGQLLRGYYRLQCLPTGGRQLWQLTPIGRI